MLLDIEDDSPDAEKQAAIRAHMVANRIGAGIEGMSLVDLMNGLAVLILRTLEQQVPRERADVREGIAGHWRHVAGHIDFTCPGCYPAREEPPEPPAPPGTVLH